MDYKLLLDQLVTFVVKEMDLDIPNELDWAFKNNSFELWKQYLENRDKPIHDAIDKLLNDGYTYTEIKNSLDNH